MSQAFGALGLTIEVLSGPSGTTPRPLVGQSVALSYTGRLGDAAGTVFDTNEGKEPLTVRVGRGQVCAPRSNRLSNGRRAGARAASPRPP